MEFGFHLPQIGAEVSGDRVTAIARAVDALGFHSLWVGDHLVFPTKPSDKYPYNARQQVPFAHTENFLEAFTVLAYAASITSRARLGTNVIVMPYRNPILTAKIVATLDVLSNGRVIFGAGVGWMPEEFEALNVPYEDRGARTDEYIRICKELWTRGTARYEGKVYRFDEVRFSPRTVQQPHPPIWIGGNTTRALRRTVMLGDAWSAAGLRPSEAAERIKELRRIGDETRRDVSKMPVCLVRGVEVQTPKDRERWYAEGKPRRPMIGLSEEIAEDVRQYAEAGVTVLRLEFRTTDNSANLETLHRFAEQVVPLVR